MVNAYQQLAPGYSKNKDSVLRSRSAVYWADKICATTPLLLLTDSADWRVSPGEQLEMVHKLYELRHPMRFELFEGGQHSLAEHLMGTEESVQLPGCWCSTAGVPVFNCRGTAETDVCECSEMNNPCNENERSVCIAFCPGLRINPLRFGIAIAEGC